MCEIIPTIHMMVTLYVFGVLCTVIATGKTEKVPAPTPAPTPVPAGAPAPFKFDEYHKTDEIFNFLKSLPAKYNFVSVQSIGKTLQDRDMLLTIISSGKQNAPVIWLDANIHASQRMSSATLLYITNKLIEKRESLDAKLQEFDFYIIVLMNPDGYQFAMEVNLFWRKNRSFNNKIKYCRGTDLNRNWSYNWGGEGATDDPCHDNYMGSSPFSEQETKAVSDFIMKNSFNKRIKAYLTLHSFGQYILYPWASSTKPLKDADELDRLGKIMANAIKDNSGKEFQVGSSAKTTFISSGESLDWAKGEAGIPYAYTIEVRDDGQVGLTLPTSQIIPSGEEIFAAVEVLAKELKI